MKFSLILATVTRTTELERFLVHLKNQTYRDFELIVADQNGDDRLVQILRPYDKQFHILHLRSQKGISRARNLGLEYMTGDVVAFPDDDCWYPSDLLERVEKWFFAHPNLAGIAGRCVDNNGCFTVGRWEKNAGLIDRYNVWRRSTSVTMFIKSEVARQIDGFDEELGAGSGTFWGAAEDMDYPIRMLAKGYSFYFEPTLFVYHPEPVRVYNDQSIARAENYGAGMGRVLRKHDFPLYFVACALIRPFGGTLLSLARCRISKALYHWALFKGRFKGWLSTL